MLSDNKDEAEHAWELLEPLGADVLPYFIEYYPKTKKWQKRVELVFRSIKFAYQGNDHAVRLGIIALEDRATLVRYRACMLLAAALRRETIAHLKALLKHDDSKTADDAKAAIDAIKHQNHNYFVDRDHTGQILWQPDGLSSGLPGIPNRRW